MTVAPVSLSDVSALLINGAGWISVAAGTMQFIQSGTMLDENGQPINLPEPWLQFVDPGDPNATPPVAGQPQGYPWRAVLGVKLNAPAVPMQ